MTRVRSAYGRSRRRTGTECARREAGPSRRSTKVPHERTLDVIGLDYYDPVVTRHFRVPGHRTAGGRNRRPTRELWDDVPESRRAHPMARRSSSPWRPGVPIWVVENGLCNRVRNGHSYRPPGRMGPSPLPARAHRRGGRSAVDRGVPVAGLLALVAGRQLRVGIVRAPVRPLRGRPPARRARDAAGWTTDAMGDDAPGAYRWIIAGLRSGDRSVLDPE